MADTIQLRAGNKTGMPTLLDRELAYVRDENALYVGTDTGNKKIGAELEATVNWQGTQIGTLQTSVGNLGSAVSTLQTEKLSASKAETQSDLAAEAELGDVVAAFNALVAAMKASGLMIE